MNAVVAVKVWGLEQVLVVMRCDHRSVWCRLLGGGVDWGSTGRASEGKSGTCTTSGWASARARECSLP